MKGREEKREKHTHTHIYIYIYIYILICCAASTSRWLVLCVLHGGALTARDPVLVQPGAGFRATSAVRELKAFACGFLAHKGQIGTSADVRICFLCISLGLCNENGADRNVGAGFLKISMLFC